MAKALNRTLLELKVFKDLCKDMDRATLNRTLLELKVCLRYLPHRRYPALNRTLLELKGDALPPFRPGPMGSQSYLIGIESMELPASASPQPLSIVPYWN